MHNSLRNSSMTFHMVANNGNIFPCLEIFDVLIFRQMLASEHIFSQKFFAQNFLDTKFLRFTVSACSLTKKNSD